MNEEYELIEHNKDNYKLSIINTLNLDSSIIENRINDELFDTYINKILKKELTKLDDISILFHPIIIKLSKLPNVYNKYALNLIGLTHREYISKIKKNIDLKKNLKYIIEYASNLDDIDYENEIENHILFLYASFILKEELNTIDKQLWFIKYIINYNANKQKLSFDVKGVWFIKTIRKYNLIRKGFLKINNFISHYNNDSIYINLIMFNLLKRKKGFTQALAYLLNNCLYHLQKQIQKSNEYAMIYDDNTYRFIKESIIYKEDSNFYDQFKQFFNSEISLNEETNRMLNELKNNPLFNEFNFVKTNNLEINNALKNTRDYNSVDNYFDKIILKKPDLIYKFPILQIEYDDIGKRKALILLINIRNEKLHNYNEQIIAFNDIIKEAPSEAYKKEIELKLSIIEKGLLGIKKCHNRIIYKALRCINVSLLENICITMDKISIDTLEEVIEQQKNEFIEKLESNRKKIFKPSTFLSNEQYLTKEYCMAARYESKLRDIRKEKKI